jgi:hypothetical protein
MKIKNYKIRWQRFAATTTLLLGIVANASSLRAQTVILDPNGDGGFENGADFAANGWTVANYTTNNTNKWFVGGVSNPSAGSNAAYISNDAGGGTYTYSNTGISRVLFWRDVVFPAGETEITLSFKIKVTGESNWDDLSVFIQNGATIPSVGQPSASSSSAPSISGTTRLGTYSIQTPAGTYVTRTLTISPVDAGNATVATTRRIIFYWENDGSYGSNPPCSIDEISLVSTLPPPPPVNDDCAGAIALTVNPSTTCSVVTSGTNLSATASSGPTSTCGTFDDDVWFSFVAVTPAHTVSLQNITGTTDLAFQVLDDCNATAAMVCSDPNSATVSGLVPGNTYYVRVATYTSTPYSFANFDICITTPANMNYVSSNVTQGSTASVVAGSENQQIIRTVVVANGLNYPLEVTQLDYNTTGSTNPADIANAKVYYTGTSTTFSTANLYGTVVANPNGSFSVIGNQALLGGTSNTNNYFWLVYDISCTAGATNVVDAQCISVYINGTPYTPTTTNPSGSRSITGTNTAVTNQPSTANVTAGNVDNQILRVQLTGCIGSEVTSLTFATAGTATAADISEAKVYFTTTTTFSNANQFGTAIPNPTGTFTVTGSQILANATGYFWLTYDVPSTATGGATLDASCSGAMIGTVNAVPATPNPTGTRTIVVPPVNDNPTGAITINVGDPCPGTLFTNVNASRASGEPVNSCYQEATQNYPSVWFKFVAPASGVVKISTDNGGTLSDTHMGLFEGSDPADYSTFTIKACDDDNGVTNTFKSILYAGGLNPGQTYYIMVNGYNGSSGTFCVTVEDIAASLLSTNTTCSSGQSVYINNTSFAGQTSIIDNSGRVLAIVKSSTGYSSTNTYNGNQNINTGSVRMDAVGTYYLDRNYAFSNDITVSNIEVTVFFLDAELEALKLADPTIVSLSDLRVSHTPGSCQANYSGALAALINPTATGSANGVHWITFTTPSFSNFYIHGGLVPLPITLSKFEGKTIGADNQLTWEAAQEKNAHQYVIERSEDGNKFNTIGLVNAKGFTGAMYSFDDKAPVAGSNYYRLKMEDKDGKFVYSNVIKLTNDSRGELAVTANPNPFKSSVTLNITGNIEENAGILVSDLSGRVILHQAVTAPKIELDLSQLNAGVYLVKYTDANQSKVIKIVKD